MRAYSHDLRERIVQAVERGGSRAEVARRFSVNERTVRRYLHRRSTTGSLAPVVYRRGPAPTIPPAQEGALLAQLRAHPDATLDEHCTRWQQEQGRAASGRMGMCRATTRATRRWSPR